MDLEVKKEGFLKKWGYLFFFPLNIIFCEIVFRIFVGNFFDIGLLVSIALSIPTGIILTILSSFFKSPKANKWIAFSISCIIFLIFSVQTVYYNIFNKLVVIYSLTNGGAEQVVSEGGLVMTALVNIWYCAPYIIALFIPTLVLIIFFNRFFSFNQASWLNKGISLVSAILVRALCVLLVISIPLVNEVYNGIFNQSQMLDKLGLLTTEYLDIKNNIFNMGADGEIVIVPNDTSSTESETPKVYGENIMDIDFDALIKTETDKTVIKLHNYFKSEKATLKNEYTGMFKDYNVITLTAEAFAPYAIDKELTPTLYKMYNEGFKFTNYYNPPWSVSTSDGEYVGCTGLIP